MDYNDIEKNKKSYRLAVIEKGYAGRLVTFGKIVCFSYELDNVEITEDDLREYIPLDNIMEQVSFVEGYDRAKKMVELGFNKENYIHFLEHNVHPRQREVVRKVLDAAYSRVDKNIKYSR